MTQSQRSDGTPAEASEGVVPSRREFLEASAATAGATLLEPCTAGRFGTR